MGDHQQGARPRVEQVLHRRQHVGVDVVGRLVEDQHVRLGQQHQQQLQPPLLAAGQLPHPRRQVRAGEPEPLQQLRRGQLATVHDVAGPGPGQHLADAVAGDLRQRVELLVEHGQPDRLAALHPPGGGAHRAGDQPQQRRLADTVGAQDRGAFAGRDAPLDAAQHLLVAIADARVDQVHDVLAESRGGQPVEFQAVAQRRHVLDQLVGGVDPELRLRRPGRRAAAQPGQLLAHQVLPLRLDGGRLPVALHPLQHVGRVTALERLDDPVVHLPGGGRHLVQEPPVVGDHEEAARVARPACLQMLREPGDPLHVEVVGRLVERDHVPVADQQRGQRDPAPLTTAQRVDRGVEVEVGDQAGQHVPDLRVGRPHVVGQLPHDRPAHRHAGRQLVGLAEHPDPDAAAPAHPAGVRFDPTGEQPQQRGLAVAVAPDDADPVALVDPEGHRVEDHPGRVLQMQRLGPEQKSHRSRVGPNPRRESPPRHPATCVVAHRPRRQR